MCAFSNPTYPPRSFEKAMVFVDGSNLLQRLRRGNLSCESLYKLCLSTIYPRQLVRVYFYTTAAKQLQAEQEHGQSFLEGCRIVLGDAVVDGKGVEREKGVDALLVADLIYHAAQKNCSYAVVVSNDSDFVHALKRVDDFGCNTGLVAIGMQAPERLRLACDDYTFLSYERLLDGGNFAHRMQTISDAAPAASADEAM